MKFYAGCWNCWLAAGCVPEVQVEKNLSFFLSDLQEQESVATKMFGDQALVAEKDMM